MSAFSGDLVIGRGRVFSDTLATTWLADLHVDPEWSGRGVGRLLLEEINDRFRGTAFYCAPPVADVELFRAVGIKPKAKLVACRRPPGEAMRTPAEVPGILIHDDAARCRAADFDDVINAAFGLEDEGPAADPFFRQQLDHGGIGFFAETTDGRLVGLIRVLSDGVTKSYVAEICIRPEWQRRGIGHALVERVVARFAHTAIWTEAFPDAVSLFKSCDIAPDADFLGCSRAPLD